MSYASPRVYKAHHYLRLRKQEPVVLQRLEGLIRVVLLRHGLQLSHVGRPVSSDGILVSGRVVHVQEREL